MADYTLYITQPRPYFAELPYYVWGQVNYDSEGDCKTPTDRDWTWIQLRQRDTGEYVEVSSSGDQWTVSGVDPAAGRIACFLLQRCSGSALSPAPNACLVSWDHQAAEARAVRVAVEFQNEILAPFATDHLFWGSWKWVGWFGTEFTWVGRWIMDSVVRNDSRAVALCIDWLRDGTFSPAQSTVLHYALNRLRDRPQINYRSLAWFDFVVPVTVEGVAFDVDLRHFQVSNPASLGIVIGIKPAMDF